MKQSFEKFPPLKDIISDIANDGFSLAKWNILLFEINNVAKLVKVPRNLPPCNPMVCNNCGERKPDDGFRGCQKCRMKWKTNK